MFGDANLDLRIDSAQDESWVRQEFDSAHKEHRRSMWELAALDDVDQLLKPSPRPPQRESSVLASARPVSGDGTPFLFRFSGFFVPTGASLIFSGWWVLSTSLRPASGNQDLFLHLFSPTGPVLSSSRFGETQRGHRPLRGQHTPAAGGGHSGNLDHFPVPLAAPSLVAGQPR